MRAGDDIELLRRYANNGEEEAFATVARRYVNLVFSAALRQARDRQMAEDISQTVFVLLARKGASLPANVILSGWLYRATGFVAADAIKSEARRRKREEIAMETLGETEAHWQEIEPDLDDSMRELGKQEREFVLMRFFENRSLREIGDVMGLSEDAAQKRVSRALERLRELLARRGAKITSVGLAGALTAYSCQAAPVGLISSVCAVATTSAGAVGLTAFTKGAIEFMAMTKLKLAAVAVVLVAAVSAPVVTQQQTVRELRQENDRLKTEFAKAAARAQTTPAAQIDPTELKRLREDAAEVHRLRAEIAGGNAAAAPAKRAATRQTDVAAGLDEATAKDPMKRHTLGSTLVREGKFPEALEHFLWCYDEGAKESPSFYGVRSSFLLNDIRDLGAKYPPALEALQKRRDDLATEIRNNQTSNPLALMDLVRLNGSLGESKASLALFDELPAGDPKRTQLVQYATDDFLTAGRYQDIVDSGRPEAAVASAVLSAQSVKLVGERNPRTDAALHDHVIDVAGKSLQALAGAGQVDRANALVDQIFNFDNSPKAKEKLLKFAEKAGNGPVAEHIRGK
jgi:RNA polymerase sigma factor (sigma-70 family)